MANGQQQNGNVQNGSSANNNTPAARNQLQPLQGQQQVLIYS